MLTKQLTQLQEVPGSCALLDVCARTNRPRDSNTV